MLDDQTDVARFLGIERQRLALFDGAKATAARASVAQNQKRRSLVAPALTNIRAARLFANAVQIFFPQDALEAQIVGIAGRFDFDPVWMSSWHDCLSKTRIDDRGSRTAILHSPSSIVDLFGF